jgi:hypothetical protein
MHRSCNKRNRCYRQNRTASLAYCLFALEGIKGDSEVDSDTDEAIGSDSMWPHYRDQNFRFGYRTGASYHVGCWMELGGECCLPNDELPHQELRGL